MRRHREGPGGHHVYLLDTMNNVLGVLVLTLMLTRLIVMQVEGDQRMAADATARPSGIDVQTGAPPHSARNSDASLEGRSLTDKTNLQTTSPSVRKLSSLQQSLLHDRDVLEEKIAELTRNGYVPSLPADVAESVARAEDKLSSLRGSVRDSGVELESLIRRTGVAPDSVVDVSLRSSEGGIAVEAAPRNVTLLQFLCVKGRVVLLDVDRLNKAISDATNEAVKAKGKKADADDFAAAFSRVNAGDSSIQIELIPISDQQGKTFLARVAPRSGVGDDLGSIRGGRSSFEKSVREIDRERTRVVFRVWDDSFEVYLAARKIADSLDVGSGWQPFASGEHVQFTLFRGGGSVAPPDIDMRGK